MKTIKSLLVVGLLFLLPITAVNAQLPEVTKQMPQFETVSINNADTKVLAQLPGIGEKKAQAIVDYRQENGDFENLSDLSNVKGIGKKLLEKLEGKISL
ncbi:MULTISPECIES: ComEA family DNA-binding protein [Pseudoalteromonas]|uniref:Competence protein n=1 Tax=Pseudoalteromonas carrageenovora IAM 12662 TaxID=1314868 RepID=A0A2K4XB51_PSEVC|nr:MULTISPECIES: helix-hairpin-helix domain-containing protein [Pseudoalteromonas]KTF12702.1 competence protein [Pseudoalteromonas sp. H103]MBE0383790.1 competence protein ComEA [Pseudoalteromonas carrageenovora IAM 12662]MDO6464650.1 helix-hairpin-helix domain-containing protein [Pseudoalteromonas carrageenovora]MDO6547856.1 helix-hairpin-helix domain-containing protein [Pseudoalteromonas carrageenovora]MDO6636671.1 helix-hairpin-helix domain-containing protein [Pseudoalteromonas carrageenovo